MDLSLGRPRQISRIEENRRFGRKVKATLGLSTGIIAIMLVDEQG
jgi:hypothetical protein